MVTLRDVGHSTVNDVAAPSSFSFGEPADEPLLSDANSQCSDPHCCLRHSISLGVRDGAADFSDD